MQNKDINIVATIGDFNQIIADFEKRIEECKISENIPQLNSEIKQLSENFKNGVYDSSKTIQKYFKNKNGKYIVFYEKEDDIEEITKKYTQIFEKLNKNLNINVLKSGKHKDKAKEIISKFNEKNENQLDLLFIHGNNKKEYDISDVDGIILDYSKAFYFNRKNKKINEIIKNCKNNATIICNIDNLEHMELYYRIKNIKESETKNIKFSEEKFLVDVKELREKTYNFKISDEVKLKLMKEYMEKNGEPITTNTVYKGYNIGNWKNSYRTAYFNGKLKIPSELLEKFIEAEILGDRQRGEYTSDEEKFDLIKSYIEKNPDKEIKLHTVDENKIPIGEFRKSLQTKVNKNQSNLTKEQIKYLKENNILNYGKKELDEIAKQYDISRTKANVITNKFESIDEFVDLYKQGKADKKSFKLNKRGIILSSCEMPQEQKQKYLKLLESIKGVNVLEDTSKFVFEEDIVSAFNKLSKREKDMIFKRFGINCRKQNIAEIIEETKISRQFVYAIQNRAFRKLSKLITIYSINGLNNLKDKFTNELLEISNMSEEQWQNYHLNYDLEYLDLPKQLTKHLKEQGYNTVTDVDMAKKEDLYKPYFATKKVDIILEKINDVKEIKKEDKIKRLKSMLKNIDSKILAYNNGYNYYMEKEDIFNQDEVIPASIVKGTNLTKKKNQKVKKELELKEVNEEIKKQDEKTEKLVDVLNLSTPKDININKKGC